MSLTTLAILPAFVPIRAPLLALVRDAASSLFVSSELASGSSPRILFQIGGISVTSEIVEIKSSQKKKVFQ